MINQFTDSKGRVWRGKKLIAALSKLADHYVRQAHDIREENAYADHVTEAVKIKALQDRLENAEKVRAGTARFTLTDAQLLNLILTGECVALLQH